MAEKNRLKKYANLLPQFIVDAKGKRSMVLLKMEVFEDLLEDLEDLAVIADRRNEPGIPWEAVKKELKANGRL